jgi:hypothetical protein
MMSAYRDQVEQRLLALILVPITMMHAKGPVFALTPQSTNETSIPVELKYDFPLFFPLIRFEEYPAGFWVNTSPTGARHVFFVLHVSISHFKKSNEQIVTIDAREQIVAFISAKYAHRGFEN